MITYKQLMEAVVERQFGAELSESYNGVSITDIILEEVSQETWEAIVEAIMSEVSEETMEFIEGSIKGSGTDRKAVLKKAYRAGEDETRNLYRRNPTNAKRPNMKDAGVAKAFKKGEYSNGGSQAAKGAARADSQDRLKDTEHGRSEPHYTGKTYYRTQTHALKKAAIAGQKPKLPN
jgi:hypothetical protein